MVVLLLVLAQVGSQAADPPWMTERWVESATERSYREFTAKLASLKWEVDVPDLRAFDKLRSDAATNYKKSPTTDNLFRLLAVLAFSPDDRTANEARVIDRLKNLKDHTMSREFARVAYSSWGRQVVPPRIDLGARLVQSGVNDGVALEAYVEDSDKVMGLQECHKMSVEYAQRLLSLFPKRDEKYLQLLVRASYQLWCRDKSPATLKLCKDTAHKALKHPQVTGPEKEALNRLLEKLDR